MSNLKKPVDLKESWKKAGVNIKLPPTQPRSATNLKRKKIGEDGSSASASISKEVIDLDRVAIAEAKRVVDSIIWPLDQHNIHSSPADQSGLTSEALTLPSPPGPESKRAQVTLDTSNPDANLQRQMDAIEERLGEIGPMPSITDLEACQRVGAGGLAFFRELTGELARPLAQRQQGEIASLTVENSYFEPWLSRVQAELESQRDNRFFDLSEENRALKEELEKLNGVQERLLAANTKVAEQEKQLERLSIAEQERDQARQYASEAKEEAQRLRTRVEELTKAKEEADVRYGTMTAEGFQMAVDLTAVLAPWINFHYFDGHHDVREGKIWLGDKMVYDPADHQQEAEDDDEESPKDAAGARDA